MGLEEEKEDLLAKHRKEQKELRGKIQAIKNAVPKGDKKRKKQATEEIAKLESDTAARHAAELAQLESGPSGCETSGEAAAAPAGVGPAEDACDDVEEGDGSAATADASAAGAKLSKAQRRKLKKEQEAREREERLEEAAKAAVNSDRSVEMRALNTLLESLSLQVHQVEADGNCLYHALAYQLHNRHSEADMKALRQQAANFMLRHRDDFAAFVSDGEAQGDASSLDEDAFERYCRRVAETTMWGGQLEIQAMARALDRKIVIYQTGSDTLTFGDDTSKGPLRLVYHRHDLGTGEHYNAAVDAVATDASEDS